MQVNGHISNKFDLKKKKRLSALQLGNINNISEAIKKKNKRNKQTRNSMSFVCLFVCFVFVYFVNNGPVDRQWCINNRIIGIQLTIIFIHLLFIYLFGDF